MNVVKTKIHGVLSITPKIFGDSRGYFLESFSAIRYKKVGVNGPFVQDNLSFSSRGVLRGLHFQSPNAQGKLVSVAIGEVFDVVVDLRVGSPTFGEWYGQHLSAEAGTQLWIPPGLAHGFLTLSETALFSYKCTEYYAPESEHCLIWNDPKIGINWPFSDKLQISAKDQKGKKLSELSEKTLIEFKT